MVKTYQDLQIYRQSLELAKAVYSLTKVFPKDETFGMRDQIRRAVASVGANIAEGFGRFHYKDKLVFFYNARGSLYETQHFLELASMVGYISQEKKQELLDLSKDLSVRLSNFIKSVGSRNNE